jgi:GNAT superfamily N-acetyltransferase
MYRQIGEGVMEAIRRATTTGDWEQATAMLHDHAEWVRTAAGIDLVAEQPGFSSELSTPWVHYDGAEGALFLAYDGPFAVGVVAVRRHDDGSAELKRMYVRPVARGRGIGDRLVDAVLDFAAGRGWHTLWLETAVGVMDRAIAVYRRNGFGMVEDRRRSLLGEGVVVMQRPVAQQLCSA